MTEPAAQNPTPGFGWDITVAASLTARQPAEQQPAEGEEIMVDTPYGVFTLPLQPAGLLSGPRFVVHVPGPGTSTNVAHLVEALEDIQKAAIRKSIHTDTQAGIALGCIAAICEITLAAHRKQGGEE